MTTYTIEIVVYTLRENVWLYFTFAKLGCFVI